MFTLHDDSWIHIRYRLENPGTFLLYVVCRQHDFGEPVATVLTPGNLRQPPLPTATALNRARVLIAGGAFEEALALLAANDGLRDSQSASLFLEGLALAVRAEPTRYLRFIEAAVVLAREPAADRVRLAQLAEALSASEQRESARGRQSRSTRESPGGRVVPV